MPGISRKAIIILTAGSFYAFFVFGFSDNLKGPTIPALLSDLGWNYSSGGTILLLAYVGFLTATLFTGFLSDRIGRKMVILLASVCLLSGIGGYSYFRTFWLLGGSMLIIGLGIGAIELGANAIIVDLHEARKGFFLNLMAVFHGIGSMVAPLYAARMLASKFHWQQVYLYALVAPAILLLIFLPIRFPSRAAVVQQEKGDEDFWKKAFSIRMWWFYLLIAVCVCTELGISSWIVEFLQKIKNQSIDQSNASLAAFFFMIVVGRLLGSFFVEKIGYLKSVVIASVGGAVCIALGVFGPAWCAFFLPLEGLFQSITFPTITAAVCDIHKKNQGSILGLLFTFAGVGGMIGPWLVGFASDRITLQYGFSIVLAYCAVMGLSSLVLMRWKSAAR
jgi:fucose permease